jgi:hypothetical protein
MAVLALQAAGAERVEVVEVVKVVRRGAAVAVARVALGVASGPLG